MTLIPVADLMRWSHNARKSDLLKLENLVEFREFLSEIRGDGTIMMAYRDASEAMSMAPETLRDYMGKIREYPVEKLQLWLVKGVSWDHFEKANSVAEIAHVTPAQLLDEAVDPGNAEGKTMTVREMLSHALGGREKPGGAGRYHWLPVYERLGKFPSRLGWEPDKTCRFQKWLADGSEFFTE